MPMEALPSLTLGLPLGFRSNWTPQTTHGPFGVSSSFGGKGVAICDVPCSNCEALFS